MTRLTHVEAMDREMSEDALMRGVVDVAAVLGWQWIHIRPARTAKGWRTPIQGPLGAGWPDLVLVRERDRRLIFAELKKELEQLRPEQREVLAVLSALGVPPAMPGPRPARVEVHVWRPSDLRDPIEESVTYRVLR